MQTQVQSNFRQTGIAFIDDIPWGTHICGFYETKRDLMEILVPYFKTGLENNEFCLWVVSEPISILEAINALEEDILDFGFYFYSSQIEIVPVSEWYLKGGNFNSERVLNYWVDKVNRALSKGYEGIRICGSTTWLNKRNWKTFMDYEAMVEKQIVTLKMIALCPYQLSKCSIQEVLDIVNNHQFSFIKSKYDWQYDNSLARFDRLNLIGKMAAGIAHEIRNPMTSVKGFIQLLQGNKEFEEYQEYFTIMIDELERANEIVTEYLSLAREKDRNIQQHNLNSILISLLPLLQADTRKEDKEIFVDTGDIDDILIDPKDIRQVILNLARNGLESMATGGILRIRTYMDDNDVILEVEDNGNGIPEEVRDSLGTPFLTTKENGTGLGLSITFKILDSYNAVTKVKSSPQGTVFTIRFPL